MSNVLKLNDLVGSELSMEIKSRFSEFIQECPEKSFYEIVAKEYLKDSAWNQMDQTLQEHGIQWDIDNSIGFIVGHCYTTVIPALAMSGHDFSREQKAHVLGWWFFNSDDKRDCPGAMPSDYTRAILEDPESDKKLEELNDLFEKNIEGAIEAYSEYYLKERQT